MQYKNKFGTIDVLRKSKKFNNKTLAVSMSGGADSTILCYLLANTIQKEKLNITIQPYSGYDIWAPLDSKGVVEIVQYIQNKFPTVDIQWPISTVFNTNGAVAPNNKNKFIRPLIEKLTEHRVIDIDMNGISMGPPIEIQQTFQQGAHPSIVDMRRRPGLRQWHEIEQAIDSLSPFKNIDKSFIVQCYKEFGIEDLLDKTNSCILPEGNCKECWWCQEREWAINKVFYT